MKHLQLLLLALLMVFMACSNNEPKEETSDSKNTEVKKEVKLEGETKLLMDYLNELGDYANSRDFPSLIKASAVYDELGKNILVIDIRKPEYFNKGHIKGAVNLDFKDIPEYFESKIKPFEYDKIIIACYSGQYASYTTSLLRLMGYGNVYSLRWGMSGWNKELAQDNWLNAISSKYENQLETRDNEKQTISEFPKLETGKATGEEILQARIKSLFEKGIKVTTIKADSLFVNPANFYIVNYDRKDKYDAGHIPGAIRYKPKGTLGIKDEMATLPVDKNIVVYCGTGHSSGFVTAYLQLFGYKAHTLLYGNNGFMHDKMLAEKDSLSWLPFTEDLIENYPLEK
ncbi:MAG: hypothetical protein HC831_14620 [Chloroflexia bacterium]|nr:hypothetical protein [Chloroflexia bacterium]